MHIDVNQEIDINGKSVDDLCKYLKEEQSRIGYKCTLDISVYNDYGDNNVEIRLHYKRPETPEETIRREIRNSNHKKQIEDYERAEYLKLKAKFEQ